MSAKKLKYNEPIDLHKLDENDIIDICGFSTDDIIDSMAMLSDDYNGYILDVEVFYKIYNKPNINYDGSIREAKMHHSCNQIYKSTQSRYKTLFSIRNYTTNKFIHRIEDSAIDSSDYGDMYGVLMSQKYDKNHRCKNTSYEIFVKIQLPHVGLGNNMTIKGDSSVYKGDSANPWKLETGKRYDIIGSKPSSFFRKEKIILSDGKKEIIIPFDEFTTNFWHKRNERYADEFISAVTSANKHVCSFLKRKGFNIEYVDIIDSENESDYNYNLYSGATKSIGYNRNESLIHIRLFNTF
jgi:hypothetical protein